jgi:uncharacterized protein YndB with AHSA1/START domain
MSEGEGLVLRLERVLPAPRETVYAAFSDPDVLAEWWGPHGFTIPEIDFEPEVAGRYRITMQPPKGEVFYLNGEFREVDPPARLSYTFAWDPPAPDDRETTVTLELEDRGEQTAVHFTQGEFATEERHALHQGGWGDSFEKLERRFAN